MSCVILNFESGGFLVFEYLSLVSWASFLRRDTFLQNVPIGNDVE